MDSEYYQQRWKIVFYTIDPPGPKMSEQDCANYLKISKSGVHFWKKRFEETGGVGDEPRPGDEPRTSASDDLTISGNLKLVIKVLLINVSIFFSFVNNFFSDNFFQTFFSSIGARGSRAPIYHQKKNQPLSVQFRNFSNYQMRNTHSFNIRIAHLIIRKISKLHRKRLIFFLVIYLCP